MEANDRELPTDPPRIEGAGNGLCQVSRMDQAKLEEAGVKAGDWVVAEEPAWDEQLRGVRVGQVERIEPIADQPGFARVLIRPAVDLTRLREVMIVK